MSCEVTVLRPAEHVLLEPGPIVAIYRDRGAAGAERVVTRALGEVTLIFAGLSAQMRDGDMTDIGRPLRRLQRMAEQLGMVSLAHVAGDLRLCLEGTDDTACAAVWARLGRIAKRSLSRDADRVDLSR